jgi:hypothetical protein
LTAKGCPIDEIHEMIKINNEIYSGTPGYIIFKQSHYYYHGQDGTPYDNGQVSRSCFLYAIRRLLHHLEQVGRIPQGSWDRYSDLELREMCCDIERKPGSYASIRSSMGYQTVHTLMLNLRIIPQENIGIYIIHQGRLNRVI